MHTHTHYCDGKGSPQDFIAKALELQFKYLGFSAHAPLPFHCKWSLTPEKLIDYNTEILFLQSTNRDKIKLLHGFEIDYLHTEGFPALRFDCIGKADFLICSIHFLNTQRGKSNHSPKFIEIDGTYSDFMLAMKDHNYALKKVLTNFLVSTDEMINAPFVFGIPKIIGHIDKIVLNAQQLTEFESMSDWFYDELLTILTNNRCNYDFVEINTRAIYKKGLTQPYPRYSFLELLAKEKIPMILNSDAHHPTELNAGYADCLTRLETLTSVNVKGLDYRWPRQ